jgi:hypothetical protein
MENNKKERKEKGEKVNHHFESEQDIFKYLNILNLNHK